MRLSNHNILSKIPDSENWFILNVLSGNADIIDLATAELLQSKTVPEREEFIEKGYVVKAKEEKKLFQKAYLDFISQRDEDEVQLFFVPDYSCNFNCSYCYQSPYDVSKRVVDSSVIEAFFSYVDREFKNRKKYITLFGGEPLLENDQHKELIVNFLQRAYARGIDVAIVTNGYALIDYLPLIKKYAIREIQVTLDGVKEQHDQRRMLKNGGKTFDRIVQGIDMVLANVIPVNLRVVVDKENFDALKDLAQFAIEKSWTEDQNFKTQIGRNYELHTCQKDSQKLFSRVSLYENLHKLILEYPDFLKFHKPAYALSRFLFENGELPDPLFDSCPGTKTEWAFDYTGKIYACTATVGKKGEELGTFYPEIQKETDKIEAWEERDVLTIDACRNCNLQLACGGGCAAVAKNSTGSIYEPDCRPVKELLEMGISLYFSEEGDHE